MYSGLPISPLAEGRYDVWTSFCSLENEDVRLSTFDGWPLGFVQPEDLARAGFIFLKQKDYAMCVYCRGTIERWVPGDDPNAEHDRQFPNCRMKPIVCRGVDWRNKPSYFQSHSSAENTPSLIAFPQYANPSIRLATFNKPLPPTSPHPSILSEAGWFYCGLSDHYMCYVCGNGLRNWKQTHNPVWRHDVTFPECPLVVPTRPQRARKSPRCYCCEN